MNPATSARQPIHLIGQFDHPFRGAELAQLDLAQLLRDYSPVQLWSTAPPHPSLRVSNDIAVQTIATFHGVYPSRGTLVLGGVHFDIGPWLGAGKFERVILICNIPNNTAVLEKVMRIRDVIGNMPELVYVSEMQRVSIGLPGMVHPVPMQLDAFWAMKRSYDDKPAGQICIGRLSRDVPEKHDPADVRLYQSWSARGLKIKIMGATCLAPQLAGDPNIELLPEGAVSPSELLESLDIYFYRTGATTEMFGRVILDAMASGLPVVLQEKGGYTAWLENGRNAIFVQSQEHAYQTVMSLSQQADLRQQIGSNARALTQALYAPESKAKWSNFYLEKN